MILNLIVLWSMGVSYSYAGMEIACPRGEQTDGTVDCYWIERWQANEGLPTRRELAPETSEPDLDEIRPLVAPKAVSN
jgi:hypothetical protein